MIPSLTQMHRRLPFQADRLFSMTILRNSPLHLHRRTINRRNSPPLLGKTITSRLSQPIQTRARDQEPVLAQALESSRSQSSLLPPFVPSVRRNRPSRFRRTIIRKDIPFQFPCVRLDCRPPSFLRTTWPGPSRSLQMRGRLSQKEETLFPSPSSFSIPLVTSTTGPILPPMDGLHG